MPIREPSLSSPRCGTGAHKHDRHSLKRMAPTYYAVGRKARQASEFPITYLIGKKRIRLGINPLLLFADGFDGEETQDLSDVFGFLRSGRRGTIYESRCRSLGL